MKSKAMLFLCLLGLIWGASFLFIKVCIESIPLFTFIGGRMAMGAIILYGILRLRGDNMPPLGRAWLPFAAIGALNALIPYALVAWGESHVSSGLAAILNGTTPIFTVLLAHYVIADEKLSVSKVLGILLGFGGTAIVMLPNLLAGMGFDLLGQVAVLCAAFSYAAAIITTKYLLHGVPAIKVSIGMLTMGTLMTLPFVLLFENVAAINPHRAAWFSWIMLGFFGTALAYLLYYWLIDNAGAIYASLVTFLLPPLGVMWGAVVLGEKASWTALVGLVVIASGILAVNGYLDRPLARLALTRAVAEGLLNGRRS